MSNNANSDRDDDKFFPARGEDEKPKAPGAFTRSFMGAGSDSDTPSPPDPKAPKSPIPFTAQFGSAGAFAPEQESPRPGSVPERSGGGNQQPTPFGRSFTKMFGSNAAAESQPSEPPAEITRVFDRSATSATVPKESRPSGFTEMFGSAQPSAPAPEPPVAPTPVESKAPGFTELFKPQAPVAQSTPAVQVPVSPLSAQPGTGRFTELFKSESTPAAAKPVQAPTPFSSSGASGFTELFKTPAISEQPAGGPLPMPATPPATESAAGGFTQLFKDSGSPSRPTSVSPKPAGELTQMISGAGLTSKLPLATPSAAQAGATRLFTGESSAPPMAPLPAGPSEYTRIVSSRQLMDLQQGASLPGNSAPPASASQPVVPGVPPTWPNVGAPPVATPQMGTPPVPPGAQPWQFQVPQHPPFAAQPPQAPNIPTALPTPPAVAPGTGSKILTYLPLIIGLNVLFLIAVLFILLFALKR